MTDETIELDKDVVAQHVIAHAREWGVQEDSTPDGCDNWSLANMTVDGVEVTDDGSTILVYGHDTGTVQELVNGGTRMNPADYRSHEVPVHIDIRYDVTANSGLGAAHTTARTDGDPREPPSPL